MLQLCGLPEYDALFEFQLSLRAKLTIIRLLATVHRNAPRSDVHQTKLSASHAPLQPFVWFDATYATYALQLVRKLHELESGTSSNFASISAA